MFVTEPVMWLVKLLAAVLKVEKGVVWLVVVKLSVVTKGLSVAEGLGVILGDVRLVEIKPSMSDIRSIRPVRMFGLGEKKVSIDPCLDGFLAMGSLSEKSDGIRLRFGSLGEAGAMASVSRIFLCSV